MMRRITWLLFCLAFIPTPLLAVEGQAARLNQEGNKLYQEGKLEEALNRYAEAVALDPGSSALHYNLGNALYRAGRIEEALGAYAEAVAGEKIRAPDSGSVSLRSASRSDPPSSLPVA